MGYRVGEEESEEEIAAVNAANVEEGSYANKPITPAKFALVCLFAAAVTEGMGMLGIVPVYQIQVVFTMSMLIFAILSYKNIKTIKGYSGASASVFTSAGRERIIHVPGYEGVPMRDD